MKILLDECVPWPMHKLLSGHSCATVQSKGWGGIKNGDLLQRARVSSTFSLLRIKTFGTNRISLAAASQFSNSQLTTLAESKLQAS